MKFASFAEFLQKLESISGRLEMTSVLADVFRQLEADEIAQACYLLQGQLLPPYTAVEFQIAVKTVIKAIARLQQPTENDGADQAALFAEPDYSDVEAAVEKQYHQLGDLGLVAEKVKEGSVGKGQNLSITEVYAELWAIAQDSGVQSQQRKLNGLVQLLQKLDPTSAKFVVRIILGRLRLGFSDMTMIDALSWAMVGSKAERDMLEQAYQKKADIGKLAQFYLQQKDEQKRLAALADYKVEVGVPVIPALCQRLNTAAEMIEKMKEVIAEPKYDGLRVQIHVDKRKPKPEQVKTYTRNLEETTHMFPELFTAIETLACETCILDAEAIGYDVQTGDLLPFQQTSQRKRKHGIDEIAKELPVRFYVFDVLSLNGEDLLQVPLKERKAKLEKVFDDNAVFYHSPEFRTSDPVALHDFHNENLAEGLEGVVVKQLNSVYQSGRKGWSWVKMKEAEGSTGKLADTLDTVVMGYYYGRGKRTGFGIGAILVGVVNEKTSEVVTVAKIGTGLTDEVLRQTKEKCDALKTSEVPSNYNVNKFLKPDVWCLPGFVVEVAADELTKSPVHSAGWALRFPRLVQFRDDKDWQQATTLTEVEQMATSSR